MGILKPYLRELLVSFLEAEANLPISTGKTTPGHGQLGSEFSGNGTPGARADGSPGELLQGEFSTSQPAAHCLSYTADLLFPAQPRGKGFGEFKTGIWELGTVSFLPWKNHLQPLFSKTKPGQRGWRLTSWVHLSVQYPVRMKASSPGGMAITGV